MFPLALACWAGARWGIVPGIGSSLVVGSVAVASVLMALGGRRRWLAVTVMLCLVISGTSAWARQHQRTQSVAGLLAQGQASGTARVILTSDVRVHEADATRPVTASVAARTLLVEGREGIVQQSLPVRLRVSGEHVDDLALHDAGSVLDVRGRFREPRPGQPFTADITLRAAPELVSGPQGWRRQVNSVRAGLRDAMRRSPPVQAGLLPSLVVGDTSRLDPALEEDFQATGLTHLTAVSGTNLTLMLVFASMLVRWIGVRGWWIRAICAVAVVAFVVICRVEPSVLRAGAMGLVALAGLGRAANPGRGLRHLCVGAFLLVLADPWLAHSMGFALSVCATAGILLWGARWTAAMHWAPTWVAEAIAVPLAAQLATQPIVTALSGQVSVVGLVANAAAGPFVGPATVLGLAAAGLSMVWAELSVLLGWLAGWCVQPIIWTATAGAALPGATWPWPAGPGMLLTLTILCLAGVPLVPEVLTRVWACLLAAVMLVLGCVCAPRPPGYPGVWQAAFCDVGQGDATVLHAGRRAAVLVDVGPDTDDTMTCLRQLGVRRIPLLVLTHFHDDHVGGLRRLLDQLPVQVAQINPGAGPQGTVRTVTDMLVEAGATVTTAEQGRAITVGEVTWTVLGAGNAPEAQGAAQQESSAENDASIVGLAEVSGALRVVLGGDVEPEGQRRVVQAGMVAMADVLKMPHHGSRRQDEPFWESTGASLAVASAGLRNRHGHPSSSALDLAGRHGMQVARTDHQGSIAVRMADGGLELRTTGQRNRR
ncbi:ComEC/Rec2 family competence protein [Luteococcus sp. Sow4_B9]|uniref:ComEC/Rec2 family competence protein n=1 Tax=Luteococcus sp. Sow4_B9 TaxID=3438792 RepID=UPI003F9803DC